MLLNLLFASGGGTATLNTSCCLRTGWSRWFMWRLLLSTYLPRVKCWLRYHSHKITPSTWLWHRPLWKARLSGGKSCVFFFSVIYEFSVESSVGWGFPNIKASGESQDPVLMTLVIWPLDSWGDFKGTWASGLDPQRENRVMETQEWPVWACGGGLQ